MLKIVLTWLLNTIDKGVPQDYAKAAGLFQKIVNSNEVNNELKNVVRSVLEELENRDLRVCMPKHPTPQNNKAIVESVVKMLQVVQNQKQAHF
ncbi:hypothetical protein NHP190012_08400 [Helicobacter sp. NHP19-012]|uniref:Uncharacterized protein n=1 Tax=Helicobacter gastrofelis TaxID=2849642 RepID=A0ABM7SM43_9HELI|nr:MULTISPECIES: hypothetical protein [unclassified Helicobacter]BCZ19198.1 hypothetical protein NHP190012_08400 [Helicobacter sp. NHP19-012]GMB95974.1 hypothetical protein NHP22001_05630 [Helicobacter sp. NHP22-001]